MLEQIEAIYGVFGPYLNMNLETFEIGFMRDMEPESEVAVWAGITAAWLAYHEKYLNDQTLPDDEERSLIAALNVISTGWDDVTTFKVPEDVGRKLIQCYDELGSGER